MTIVNPDRPIGLQKVHGSQQGLLLQYLLGLTRISCANLHNHYLTLDCWDSDKSMYNNLDLVQPYVRVWGSARVFDQSCHFLNSSTAPRKRSQTRPAPQCLYPEGASNTTCRLSLWTLSYIRYFHELQWSFWVWILLNVRPVPWDLDHVYIKGGKIEEVGIFI